MTRESILLAIYDAIRCANELREPDAQLVCSETTSLYGESGGLDSLGLVSLILDVEEAIRQNSGRNIALADSRAMSLKRNPFRTVESLADYVTVRLQDAESCMTVQ